MAGSRKRAPFWNHQCYSLIKCVPVFFPSFVSTFWSNRILWHTHTHTQANELAHTFCFIGTDKERTDFNKFLWRAKKNNNKLTTPLNVCFVVNHFWMLHNVWPKQKFLNEMSESIENVSASREISNDFNR